MQTKSKKEKLAFAQGAAFRLGSAYGKGKKCAQDAALSKGKLNTAALNYWKQKGGEFLDKFFSSFVRDKDFISGLNKL